MRRTQKTNKKVDDDTSTVKYLFGLYQCLHHLSFLTRDASNGKAPLFSRNVADLDRMFMPALTAWNPYYWKICHQTNEQWRKTQIKNLIDHYNYCMDQYLGVLSSLRFLADLSKDMIQARKWARQSYKKKFQNSLFYKVDQMVRKLYEPKSLKDQASCIHSTFENEKKKKEKKKAKKTGNTEKATASDPKQGPPSSERKETPAAKEAVAGTSSEWREVTRNGRGASAPRSEVVGTSGSELASTPVKRKRGNSESGSPSPRSAHTAPKRASVEEVLSEPASTPNNKTRGRTLSGPPSPGSDPMTPKRTKSATFAEKVKSPMKSPKTGTNSKPKNEPAILNFPKLPGQGQYKKGQDMHSFWYIPKVFRNILILGDSNMARPSNFKRDDVQIASYSGCNLSKMHKLIENFKFGSFSENPGRKPSHVVFSIGLNDRGLADSTILMSLKKLILAAKAEFPDSKISFYQQPFDSRLKQQEKSALTTLNDSIETLCKSHACHCIPPLPTRMFKVCNSESYKIHWTSDCANATMNHFFKHLN